MESQCFSYGPANAYAMKYCQMIEKTSNADKLKIIVHSRCLFTCFLLGTRIGQASECFVYWKDPATSDTWVIFHHFYFSYSIADCVSSVIFQHFYFSYSFADCVSWICFYISLLLAMLNKKYEILTSTKIMEKVWCLWENGYF